MFDEAMLRGLWPRGDSKVPGLIAGIVAASPAVFAKYGLTSPLVIAHAMAQFSHECGAGTEMVENINYLAARACRVWPTRFSNEADVYRKLGSYAGDPQFSNKLIDQVYGNRMGNRPGSHDGSTFIGRGLSQVTGREGYEKLGRKVGRDFIIQPNAVNLPELALECGVADFVLCNCLPWAEQDNIKEVTHHLNGGYIGLAEREQWLARWKAALGVNKAAQAAPAVPAAAAESPSKVPQHGAAAAVVAGGTVAARASYNSGAHTGIIITIIVATLAIAVAGWFLVHWYRKQKPA